MFVNLSFYDPNIEKQVHVIELGEFTYDSDFTMMLNFYFKTPFLHNGLKFLYKEHFVSEDIMGELLTVIIYECYKEEDYIDDEELNFYTEDVVDNPLDKIGK